MINWYSIVLNCIRLTYNYKLVDVMLYEKLVKRDINQLSSSSETVRIHLLWKYSLILTPDNIIRESSLIRGVYKEYLSYTCGGATILVVSSFVLTWRLSSVRQEHYIGKVKVISSNLIVSNYFVCLI